MDPTTGRAARFRRPQPEPEPPPWVTDPTIPTPLEALADEVDELAALVRSLDARGIAAKALRQGDRDWNRKIVPTRDEWQMQRFLEEQKMSLLNWLAILRKERGQHARAIQAVEAAAVERHKPLIEQAHNRVAPDLIVAEAAARAAVRAAELARDAAKAALTNHEAHVPDAAGRPAWHKGRRGLEEDFEDKKSTLEDMCAALADRERALKAAIDVAWAELRIEKAEAHVERAIALQARLAAVQAEIDAENEADQLERADLNAARLLEV